MLSSGNEPGLVERLGNRMKIIDWECKGNLVRFYLGDDECSEYWGDDWNDAPYEHNAGEVYSEYVAKIRDVAFPFEWKIAEPSAGHTNSNYSKEAMKAGKVPILAVVPPPGSDGWEWLFEDILSLSSAVPIFMEQPESRLDEIEAMF